MDKTAEQQAAECDQYNKETVSRGGCRRCKHIHDRLYEDSLEDYIMRMETPDHRPDAIITPLSHKRVEVKVTFDMPDNINPPQMEAMAAEVKRFIRHVRADYNLSKDSFVDSTIKLIIS